MSISRGLAITRGFLLPGLARLEGKYPLGVSTGSSGKQSSGHQWRHGFCERCGEPYDPFLPPEKSQPCYQPVGYPRDEAVRRVVIDGVTIEGPEA
jgi:hypothetical protein